MTSPTGGHNTIPPALSGCLCYLVGDRCVSMPALANGISTCLGEGGSLFAEGFPHGRRMGVILMDNGGVLRKALAVSMRCDQRSVIPTVSSSLPTARVWVLLNTAPAGWMSKLIHLFIGLSHPSVHFHDNQTLGKQVGCRLLPVMLHYKQSIQETRKLHHSIDGENAAGGALPISSDVVLLLMYVMRYVELGVFLSTNGSRRPKTTNSQ